MFYHWLPFVSFLQETLILDNSLNFRKNILFFQKTKKNYINFDEMHIIYCCAIDDYIMDKHQIQTSLKLEWSSFSNKKQ